MTTDKQRIVIAVALGWRITQVNLHDKFKPVIKGIHPDVTRGEMSIPDTTNLTVLAHSRDQLINTPDLRVQWANTLRDVVGKNCKRRNKLGKPLVSDIDLLFATAEELTEALLKTLRLWEGPK